MRGKAEGVSEALVSVGVTKGVSDAVLLRIYRAGACCEREGKDVSFGRVV